MARRRRRTGFRFGRLVLAFAVLLLLWLAASMGGLFSAVGAFSGVDEFPRGETCQRVVPCSSVGACEVVCAEFSSCDVFVYKDSLIACVNGVSVPPAFVDGPRSSEEAGSFVERVGGGSS